MTPETDGHIARAIAQAHNTHTDVSSGTELFGYIDLVSESRRLMGRILRKYMGTAGYDLSGETVVLVGPGEGYEAAFVAECAGIPLDHVGDEQDSIRVLAIEPNRKRAAELPRLIPRAQVEERSFMDIEFPSNTAIIQAGFVWNDLTMAQREELLHRSFVSLKPGGVLVITDSFLSYPTSALSRQDTPNDVRTSLLNEIHALYDGLRGGIIRAKNEGLIPPYVDIGLAISSLHEAEQSCIEGQDGRESFDSRKSFTQFVAQITSSLGKTADIRWFSNPGYGTDGNFGAIAVIVQNNP